MSVTPNEVRLLQCALLAQGSQSRLLIPSMCIGSLSKLPFILYTSFFFMYPSEHVLWNSSSSRNHTRPSCGLWARANPLRVYNDRLDIHPRYTHWTASYCSCPEDCSGRKICPGGHQYTWKCQASTWKRSCGYSCQLVSPSPNTDDHSACWRYATAIVLLCPCVDQARSVQPRLCRQGHLPCHSRSYQKVLHSGALRR